MKLDKMLNINNKQTKGIEEGDFFSFYTPDQLTTGIFYFLRILSNAFEKGADKIYEKGKEVTLRTGRL